jgi:hypothetical protein
MYLWGAGCFGLVIGWVTYRTLRRAGTSSITDITTVIGALGGGAVLALFPAKSEAFGAYAIGLAIGFFFYLLTAVLLARTKGGDGAGTLEWMGESPSGTSFLGG